MGRKIDKITFLDVNRPNSLVTIAQITVFMLIVKRNIICQLSCKLRCQWSIIVKETIEMGAG